jgi:hypothetical protein
MKFLQVMRQMSFIEKIVSFGWAEDGRFDEDNETLTRAVVRYHAWLDLMHAMPAKFVVPTLVSPDYHYVLS